MVMQPGGPESVRWGQLQQDLKDAGRIGHKTNILSWQQYCIPMTDRLERALSIKYSDREKLIQAHVFCRRASCRHLSIRPRLRQR